MKSKAIKICAAVTSAALLFGGLFLLFRDDVQVKKQQEKLEPFMPDFSVIEMQKKENANETESIKIKEENIEVITEKVQQLSEEYNNSVGWLYIPDTEINYPVMYSGDNEYYLHRAVDGSYLLVGSVFLDGSCEKDFSESLNILYGHNMSDGSMFADVMKYIDHSFFDTHNYALLTTETDVYRVDFFSLSQPDSTDSFYDISADFDVWRENLRRSSYIWRQTEMSENSKYISLSTCTDSEGESRTVLTGKLTSVTLDPYAQFTDS
ncbi:MAG: class B sortase [Ruminococcus sp.]|nr:class B sortase [Ruminococcus sp.]